MTNFKEKIRTRGSFQMRVFKSGTLVEAYEEHNLIVNAARDQMARLIAGDADDRHITHIAFGTNGDQAAAGDTEITEPFVKTIDGAEFPETGQVTFNWSLGTGEANGKAIMEFGLLTLDGTLFARRARNEPLHKDSDFSLEGEWTIEF